MENKYVYMYVVVWLLGGGGQETEKDPIILWSLPTKLIKHRHSSPGWTWQLKSL